MGDMLNELDFHAFEEEFKLPQKSRQRNDNKDTADGRNKNTSTDADEPVAQKAKLKSLMDHTRLRNIAICTRKIPPMPIPDLIRAINSLDIQVSYLQHTVFYSQTYTIIPK